ncbi:hypothetical protein V8D89_016236, partial [Ganoderma adspersum]
LQISRLLQDPCSMQQVLAAFCHRLKHVSKIDVVVGIEAAGCLLGAQLAMSLGASFVPFLKVGEVGGNCICVDYGEGVMAMPSSAIHPGQKVVVVGGVLTTGYAAQMAGKIIMRCKGWTVCYLFVAQLHQEIEPMIEAEAYSVIVLE